MHEINEALDNNDSNNSNSDKYLLIIHDKTSGQLQDINHNSMS